MGRQHGILAKALVIVLKSINVYCFENSDNKELAGSLNVGQATLQHEHDTQALTKGRPHFQHKDGNSVNTDAARSSYNA